MWSFGCILYELYVGYPLFPGEDEKDHMALMMEVKGIPPRSVLARSSRRKVFFDEDYNPIITPNSRGKIRMPGNKNLFALMNCSDKDFVDFIDVSYFQIYSFIFRNASSGNLNRDSPQKWHFRIHSSLRP
jgi:dual specificity tyrosine-phosphorylation-regulated kinase 2/3/4